MMFIFLPFRAGEMVRQARILAQATSDLVNAIKADAEGESDLENSRKLLSAAKLLADATAKMVEAAKVTEIMHPSCWRLLVSGLLGKPAGKPMTVVRWQ